MSTATPPPLPCKTASAASSPPLPYERISAPRPSLLQRINWRIIVFAVVVIGPIGGLFYVWLNETLSGGIHDYGAYKQVDLKAMSTFDMDQNYAKPEDIPKKWRDLEGQQVLMIGEMVAPRDAGDSKLSYFQLVYNKAQCCFKGPPLAQHFVDGDVNNGAKAYYYDTMVKVWGKIHIYIRRDPATGQIKSIYHVNVDKVEPIES
jgi:hypothetical protein